MTMRNATRMGLATWIALLTLAPMTAGAIFPANMSSLIDLSSPEIGRFLEGPHAPHAGGVVPSGHVDFKNGGERVEPKDLKLRFSRADGSVYLVRGKDAYKLSIDSNLTCPLAQFVSREGVIVFTIPPAKPDVALYKEFGLMAVSSQERTYVAKEFNNPSQTAFLERVDLGTMTESLDDDVVTKIKSTAHQRRSADKLVFESLGTYVNADFNVRYEARLTSSPKTLLVDIGGVPLRYYWNYARDGKPMLFDVEVFTYPAEESGLQYEAVAFFQNAAVFRELRDANSPAFQSFVKEACTR